MKNQKGESLHIFFFLFRDAPVEYGGSQGRGPVGATDTSLHHSHSNAGSDPHLRPTAAHGNARSPTH